MKRLEFHITYICNHACIFCSEDDRMQKYKKNPLTELQVRTILLDRAKKWFNHVNFTWGEPMLFPNFLKLLEFTKKIWYKIYVWSNGTMLADEKFAGSALKYIDELSLSIHWYDQKTCLEQTWDKDHYDMFIKKIISNINKYGDKNYFFTNIVLNKKNYKDGKKIIEFILETWFNPRQVLISNIAPEWIADHNFSNLAFDLIDFKKYIPGIVEYCNDQKIILRFFGLPTCILGEKYQWYANDLHWEERHTIERYTNTNWKIILKDIYSPDNSRKRTFINKCFSCSWKEKPCTGVFKKYLEYYSI